MIGRGSVSERVVRSIRALCEFLETVVESKMARDQLQKEKGKRSEDESSRKKAMKLQKKGIGPKKSDRDKAVDIQGSCSNVPRQSPPQLSRRRRATRG